MRLRRKLNNRKPLRRSGTPTAVGIPAALPAAAPSSALWRMRCMCGVILEISSEDDGKHQSCPTCRRRFNVRFTEDLTSGQKGVSLLYISDGNKSNGESTVGGGTTSFELPSGSKDPNPAGLLLEPDLPDEAHFKCACGALLAIARPQYEKRSKCPVCGARMLVFMLFNSRSSSFNLQLFSLVDKSSGSTQVLSKL
jgi:hypothetical protein